MRAEKVWFAEKQNGEVITLSEIEALTHFEKNQIASRMKLRFIGTSDGVEYRKGREEVIKMLDEKRHEEVAGYMNMNDLERKVADAELRQAHSKEIKEITDKAYEAELAVAKANGVQQPDSNLRIITKATGVNASREKIINSMN